MQFVNNPFIFNQQRLSPFKNNNKSQFSLVLRQIEQSLSEQIKSRIFYKKTVDVGQSDLHNTRHLLRGKMVKAT